MADSIQMTITPTTTPSALPLVEVMFSVIQPQPHLHGVVLTTPMEDVLHGSQLSRVHAELHKVILKTHRSQLDTIRT